MALPRTPINATFAVVCALIAAAAAAVQLCQSHTSCAQLCPYPCPCPCPCLALVTVSSWVPGATQAIPFRVHEVPGPGDGTLRVGLGRQGVGYGQVHAALQLRVRARGRRVPGKRPERDPRRLRGLRRRRRSRRRRRRAGEGRGGGGRARERRGEQQHPELVGHDLELRTPLLLLAPRRLAQVAGGQQQPRDVPGVRRVVAEVRLDVRRGALPRGREGPPGAAPVAQPRPQEGGLLPVLGRDRDRAPGLVPDERPRDLLHRREHDVERDRGRVAGPLPPGPRRRGRGRGVRVRAEAGQQLPVDEVGVQRAHARVLQHHRAAPEARGEGPRLLQEAPELEVAPVVAVVPDVDARDGGDEVRRGGGEVVPGQHRRVDHVGPGLADERAAAVPQVPDQVRRELGGGGRGRGLQREVLHPKALVELPPVDGDEVARGDHDPHAGRVEHQQGLGVVRAEGVGQGGAVDLEGRLGARALERRDVPAALVGVAAVADDQEAAHALQRRGLSEEEVQVPHVVHGPHLQSPVLDDVAQPFGGRVPDAVVLRDVVAPESEGVRSRRPIGRAGPGYCGTRPRGPRARGRGRGRCGRRPRARPHVAVQGRVQLPSVLLVGEGTWICALHRRRLRILQRYREVHHRLSAQSCDRRGRVGRRRRMARGAEWLLRPAALARGLHHLLLLRNLLYHCDVLLCAQAVCVEVVQQRHTIPDAQNVFFALLHQLFLRNVPRIEDEARRIQPHGLQVQHGAPVADLQLLARHPRVADSQHLPSTHAYRAGARDGNAARIRH